MKQFFFLLLFLSVEIFPQAIILNNYQINVENNTLDVTSLEGEKIITMGFENPVTYFFDLDGDTSDELIIIDSTKRLDKVHYKFYLFNTIEPFYLVDSLNSGFVQPYYTTPDEMEEVIIVTGNEQFSFLDEENQEYLPLNCWKFEAGELYNVNEEIYDLFIAENDAILAVLDDYLHSHTSDCSATEKMKGLIAAAYVNYINAAEHSLASQFLKNYYLCPDLESFKSKIDDLLSN